MKKYSLILTLSLLVFLGIVLIMLFGRYGFMGSKRVGVSPNIPTPGRTECTMEAKACPDGTTVGRSGPKCEFAPCPSVPVKNDNVRVTSPLPESVVKNSVAITGEARGTWYFEASFPVTVRDANDKILGTGIAQAKGEWMTTDFVPFETTITFTSPTTTTGFLVLNKDNPSGLPENDAEVRIPIRF